MRTIICSGILVSGILLIRKVAMGKISRKLQYSLWLLLPILLLLVPYVKFDVAVPSFNRFYEPLISFRQDFQEDATQAYGKGTSFADYVTAPEISAFDTAKIKAVSLDNENKKISIYDIWKVSKNATTALLFIYLIIKNAVFALYLKKSRSLYKKDEETGMNVYTVPRKETPFLFIKDIYLNEENLINDKYARYMILHEYCHFRQGDPIWNILKYIFCCVYWYNPFIWLALYFVNKDCELACDEAVIKLIGNENRQDYGMSLLILLSGKQADYGFSIETSMRGRKKFISERINMLSNAGHNRRITAVIACMTALLLAGCSLIKPYEKKIEPALSAPAEQEHPVNNITFNSYYNNIKRNGDILYFAYADGLYCFNPYTISGWCIADGKFLLGNISDGYLYFLKHPEGSEESGIGRIDLTTLQEQILVPWNEDFSLCNNVYAKNDCVYIEVLGKCEGFKIDGDTVVKLTHEDNYFYNAVNQFDLSKEGAFTINYGYINSIDSFSKFTLINENTYELYICDTDTQKVTKKDNCFGNILICDKGVVYTDLDGNIILCPINDTKNNTKNDMILFNAKDYGYTVDYGAYSNNGLYAFKENGNALECKRIYWWGSMNEVRETHDALLNTDSSLSTFNDCIVYSKNDRFVINVCDYENAANANDFYWMEIQPHKNAIELTMSIHAPMRKYIPDGKTTILPPETIITEYYFDDSNKSPGYFAEETSHDYIPYEVGE